MRIDSHAQGRGALIGGGGIFIYSGSARLVSFEIVDFKRS